MRKRPLVMIVLLSSVWVMAQTAGQESNYLNRTSSSKQQAAAPDTAPTQATQSSGTDPHESLLEGCLGRSRASLTLTDTAGKVYELRGDTGQLAEHVGQQVSIIGTEEAGSASRGAGAQPTFTLKKVKIVGRVCLASK